MINHLPTEEDLKEPLKDGLEYYDATPSIEECAKALANLEEAIMKQGRINAQLIDLLNQALNRIAILEGNRQKPNPLILPPRLQ
jgi:hypothetical protein